MTQCSSFQFKRFKIEQGHSALKVGTDAVLLGAIATGINPHNILDIGTGTGILALMMAQKYICPIIAIDIDKESILDAQENITNSEWGKRIEVKNIDLQSFTSETKKHFDFIVCNPPFFSDSLVCKKQNKALAKHTINLTPEILFSCSDKLLDETGVLYIIIPTSEKSRFCEQAMTNNMYLTKEITISAFINSEKPNRCILKFTKTWEKFQSDNLSIRNQDLSYTQQFKELTKDFYTKI